MSEPSIEELIEASSLGTPEAKALRASVSDEDARRVVERAFPHEHEWTQRQMTNGDPWWSCPCGAAESTAPTAAEHLRADIAKEESREDRDAWSQGFAYGMKHALRVFEVNAPARNDR